MKKILLVLGLLLMITVPLGIYFINDKSVSESDDTDEDSSTSKQIVTISVERSMSRILPIMPGC